MLRERLRCHLTRSHRADIDTSPGSETEMDSKGARTRAGE